jgi:hypothetical protein
VALEVGQHRTGDKCHKVLSLTDYLTEASHLQQGGKNNLVIVAMPPRYERPQAVAYRAIENPLRHFFASWQELMKEERNASVIYVELPSLIEEKTKAVLSVERVPPIREIILVTTQHDMDFEAGIKTLAVEQSLAFRARRINLKQWTPIQV